MFRIVNEVSHEIVENPALRAMKEGRIFGLANHTLLISKSGAEICIDDSGAPIRDEDGKIVGAVLVFRDITERRRAERASALLAEIVASSEDAIISKSLEGKILSWNSAAERMFGYAAEEAIGQPITMLIPPDRMEEEESILARFRQGQRVEHYETVRLSKTGTPLDISLTVSPVRDPSGRIVGASKIARDITARKKTEEALREQREWLRVTLHSIGDAVIATDTEGAVTFLNPVAESLTGWKQPEAHGKQLLEVFHIVNEQTREPVDNPALRAIKEGEVVGLANHTVLIAKDGTEITIDDSGSPIVDHEGKILGAVLIFRDITERRAAEDRFRMAVESAPNAMVMIDDRGLISLVNSQTERLFGYSRDELIARPVEMLVPERFSKLHPEYRASFAATPQARAMGAGRDLFGQRKDGSEVPIEIGLSPIKTNGKTLVLSSIVDITERREAELRMSAHLAITRILAESPRLSDAMPRILMTVGETLGWRIGDLWMLDPEAAVLRCVHQWHDPGVDVQGFMAANQRFTFAPGVGLPGRILMSGRPEWISDVTKDDNFPRAFAASTDGLHCAVGFPILFGDRVLGVMEFFSHEILEPDPQMLAMLEAIGSQIGQFVERRRAEEERSSLLAREKSAREQAEAASRAKDEFVAMVSHELRAPLNAILGWTQLLQTGKFDEDQAVHALDIIERNTKIQVKLIEDLLDISRVISGKLVLRVHPVEIGKIIEAATESIRAAANVKSIHLDVHTDPAGCWVSGDPNRMQQIVWNLLSNAVKFTPAHGRIEVRAERVGSQIQVTVSDSGAGIESGFLPYVFDRFSQASPTSVRRHGGLGLGLAIVKNLIELHGGTVRAESAGEGLGATFTLMLPMSAAYIEEAAPAGLKGFADSAATFGTLLQGVRLMVVDDEADTRELLTAMLGASGAEVRAYASASQALEEIEQWKPSILISDIGMPNEDGYSLIRRVRALGARGGDIPAIALTGYAKSEDRTRALAAGFQMHVPKPVESAELIMVVASLVGRIGATNTSSG